jgi:hemoglobin
MSLDLNQEAETFADPLHPPQWRLRQVVELDQRRPSESDVSCQSTRQLMEAAASSSANPMTSSTKPAKPLPDLTGRADIERLVNAFYGKVQGDDLLGFIFTDIAKTDWITHLPKMYAFWESMIFRTGNYVGNPLAAHARLTAFTTMGREQFQRWLALFTTTVDELFAGEKAEHIKRAAEDMANVIHARINHVPDARFDPANLTPEQRARYSNYKPAVPGAG